MPNSFICKNISMIGVTGGTGLLGSHLLARLVKENRQVVVLLRPESNPQHIQKVFRYYFSSDQAFENLEIRRVDFFDLFDLQEKLIGITQFIHTAAQVSFHPRDAKSLINLNEGMTENLVNWALEKKVEKFIHISSIATIGTPKDPTEVANEETEWKLSPSSSVYAISKFQSEMQVWRGSEEGLKVVMVNPGVILGPGNWESSSVKLFHTIANGIKYTSRGGTGFVDVRDVVEILIKLLDSEISGERFIAVGENTSYHNLIEEISKLTGNKLPSFFPPHWLLGFLWRFEALRSFVFGTQPLITKETASATKRKKTYSSSKVQQEFDFEFTPLEETLSYTYEAWRKEFQAKN